MGNGRVEMLVYPKPNLYKAIFAKGASTGTVCNQLVRAKVPFSLDEGKILVGNPKREVTPTECVVVINESLPRSFYIERDHSRYQVMSSDNFSTVFESYFRRFLLGSESKSVSDKCIST